MNFIVKYLVFDFRLLILIVLSTLLMSLMVDASVKLSGYKTVSVLHYCSIIWKKDNDHIDASASCPNGETIDNLPHMIYNAYLLKLSDDKNKIQLDSLELDYISNNNFKGPIIEVIKQSKWRNNSEMVYSAILQK